jgi:uncharacterized protein DUF2442
VLHGVLFEPLQDLAMFNAARIDPEGGTLVWPNGADFDPATLHDWPDVREELAAESLWTSRPTNSGVDLALADLRERNAALHAAMRFWPERANCDNTGHWRSSAFYRRSQTV